MKWLLHNPLICVTHSTVNTCVMLNKTFPLALFDISNVQSVIFPVNDAVHNSFRGACEVFRNDKLRFSSNIPDGVLVHLPGL